MIAIWLWFGVARADTFDNIVREKVALLQIVHRAEGRRPIAMDDPDRWQVVELLTDTEQRGAVFNLLQSPGDVSLDGEDRASLRRALRQDGYAGDQTNVRRQLQLELLGLARRHRVADFEVVAAIRKNVLVHTALSRQFQTPAAGRAHADLVATLGQLGSPEGLGVILDYAHGLSLAWPDVQNTSHFHQARAAARQIAPAMASDLIAAAIGATPPAAADVAPTRDATSALVPACEVRLGVARRLGRWFRRVLRRPRP